MISTGVVAGMSTASTAKGIFYAVPLQVSPGIRVFKEVNGVAKEIGLPISFTRSFHALFSPDGKYLAVVSTLAPYFYVLKRTGDKFTVLPTPSTIPTNTCYCVDWSHDCKYLAVGHGSGQYTSVYKLENDVLTIIPTSVTNGGAPRALKFSPDGTALYAPALGRQNVIRHAVSNGVLTSSAIIFSTDRYVTDLDVSSDGKVVIGVSPYAIATEKPLVGAYKAGDSWNTIQFANNSATALGQLANIDISPDGLHFVASVGNASRLLVYTKSTDNWYASAGEITWDSGLPTGVKYSKAGDKLLVFTSNPNKALMVYDVVGATHTLNRVVAGITEANSINGDWYSEL